MPIVEYPPGASFPGVIGRTTDESSPAWPVPPRPATGTPNVVVVVLDDTGFGQLGCYGSPIQTPHMDALAANGLRYNNMHTTALCSPSRSCIVTGRNHHANSMAAITELATGYPGYNGVVPFENGFLSEMLLEHGYNTFMVGKWHLTPSNQETAVGPYDRWPLARGFQRFYGFLGGDTSQWYPDLVYDNHQVEPPRTPEEGYHLTEDLVDKAVQFIADADQIDPDKPFYLHLCFGATHAPHHAPAEWSDRYKGMFDDGWDAYRDKTFARQKELGIVPADAELSRHDPDVPDWEQPAAGRAQAVQPDDGSLRGLPQPHRPPSRPAARLPRPAREARQHAGHARLGQRSERRGRPDRNHERGAVLQQRAGAARGQPRAHRRDRWPQALQPLPVGLDLGGQHPVPQVEAGDLPRRHVRPVHRVLAERIAARGEVRTQYAHIIDMVPTILDLLGVEPPTSIRGVTQAPLHGLSLVGTIDDVDAASPRTTQYFEMLGHRAIYHDGWRAVCPWPGPSFTEAGVGFGQPISADRLSELDASGWELYHVAEDFAENHDVAADNRDRLIALIGTWYSEAGRYGVLPVDGSGLARMISEKPLAAPPRDTCTYYPGTQSVPFFAAPKVLNRPHSITADVEIPESGAEGVLLSQGTAAGGYSLYVKDGRLHYVHNYVGRAEYGVVSADPVPSGRHELRFEFEPTGQPDLAAGKGAPGRLQLYVDGALVGAAEAPVTTPFVLNPGALTCGANPGSPVTGGYPSPFRFTGTIHTVKVDVSGDLIHDSEAELRVHMARQ